MKVRILKTDKRLGLTEGEVYEAKPYSLDPWGKFELLARVPDGFDPDCTAYRGIDAEITGAKE